MQIESAIRMEAPTTTALWLCNLGGPDTVAEESDGHVVGKCQGSVGEVLYGTPCTCSTSALRRRATPSAKGRTMHKRRLDFKLATQKLPWFAARMRQLGVVSFPGDLVDMGLADVGRS